MLANLPVKYDRPDEELSYTELWDRIRNEVTNALPKKERIMLLARKLEDQPTIKDTICDRICTDYKGVISRSYIKKCLPDEYKRKNKQRKKAKDSRATIVANGYKNILEQKATSADACRGSTCHDSQTNVGAETRSEEPDSIRDVNSMLKEKTRYMARLIKELKKQLAEKTEQVSELKKENESLKNLLEQQKIPSGAHGKGEETPLKDTHRLNVKSNFEKEKRLQKQPTDATGERDSLDSEYKILKEKPGQEYFLKVQEKFWIQVNRYLQEHTS